jgi:tetratricopeptide (TPR) repeat protein
VAARLVLARASQLQGARDRADGIIRQLASSNPDVAAVHLQIAQAAVQRKDTATARREFSRSLELAPASIEALRGLVGLDLAEKRTARAQKTIDEQLAKRPRDSNLAVLAADVYGAIGQSGRQEVLLRGAVDDDSGNLDAFSRLAELYVRQNRLEQAKAQYERIARERPASAVAPTLIGMILETQDHPADAQRVYEQVVAAHPDAAVAANNLAWLYAERGGNLDLALQLAQTAKARMPRTAQVDDTLGWIYYKKDLPDLAIPSLQASVNLSPRNPTYQFHLGLAYVKAGDAMSAVSAFDAALKQNPGFQEAKTARAALVRR